MAELTFYTNPMSRGQIARWMLHEAGATYDEMSLDYGTTMKAPEYLAINPDGSVNDIRILRSSGQRVLDEAAVRIVQLSAPFQPFPADMRKDVDVLEIIRTWQFQRGNTFSSF